MSSLAPHDASGLARLLDGGEAGEEAEAFDFLLEDEFEAVYPPSLRDAFLERAGQAGWPEPFLRCPGCATVFLRRFRPDGVRCRECAAALEPTRLSTPAPKAQSLSPTRTIGGALGSAQAWDLSAERPRRDLALGEDEVDWLARREAQREVESARAQAASWLGGVGPDPSDEARALPLEPAAASDEGGLGEESSGDTGAARSSAGAEAVSQDLDPAEVGAGDSSRGSEGAAAAADAAAADAAAAGAAAPGAAGQAAAAADAAAAAADAAPGAAGQAAAAAAADAAAAGAAAPDAAARDAAAAAADAAAAGAAAAGAAAPDAAAAAADAAAAAAAADAAAAGAAAPDAAAPDVAGAAAPDAAAPDAAAPDVAGQAAAAPDVAGQAAAAPDAGAQAHESGPGSAGPPTGAPEAAATWRLVPSGAGEAFALEGDRATLGTGRRCEVVLRQRGVAFKHLLLGGLASGEPWLEDLAGRGDVALEGEVLASHARVPLRHGARFSLGPLSFTLEALLPSAGALEAPAGGSASPPAQVAASPAHVEAAARPADAASSAPAAEADATSQAEAEAGAASSAPEGPVELAPASLGVSQGDEAASGAGPASLREETGRRAGRVHQIAPGTSFTLGTARRGEVVLRQRGVAFKHVVIRVDLSGRATLEDLGAGGTWVGDLLLEPGSTRALREGDELRLGEARLTLSLQVARRPTKPAPARPQPEAPWQAPSAAEVAAARHTPPVQILAALPASQLDLVARAASGEPYARRRAGLARSERPLFDHEAEAFTQLARSVLDARYLPEPAEAWLRWEAGEEAFLARSALPDGTTLILAPWELLARLPEPLPGSGPSRVGRFLELLLPRGGGRLVSTEEEELPGGFWRCRYASRAGLCQGRFNAIEARSNGHVLAATFDPRFPFVARPPRLGEDPLEEALDEVAGRLAWRPPARGSGEPAPPVPGGGRRREHRLPRRSKAPKR